MDLIRGFSQRELLNKYKVETGEDSLGICMRLAFKWLACRHVGGAFAYEAANVKKISEKMNAYTREALDMLKSADFKGDERLFASKYVVTDLLQIKRYINNWGVRIKDVKKTVYNNIYCADAMRASLPNYFLAKQEKVSRADMALMITFYMNLTKGKVQSVLPQMVFEGADSRMIMVGHAVAYFGRQNVFFDPNYGEYQVSADQNMAIAEEIEAFIADNYPTTGNSLDRVVLRIASRF